MIASVVATLEELAGPVPDVIDEISKLPGVEIGAFDSDSRRVPITIDSPAPNALENTTRRLQECRGVAFVDVVFVHFDDTDDAIPLASERESWERRFAPATLPEPHHGEGSRPPCALPEEH